VDTVKEIEKEKPDVREEKQDEKTDVKPDSSMASKGQSNDGKGSAEGTGLVTTLDVFPRFPGGDQARLYFLRSNIKYPSLAIKAGIQGDVMVLFIVEADGTLSNVSINKGIGGGCDEEAIRVTKLMPGWDPGKRSGKSVRVLVRMPIVFKIPGKK
jgi:protein TonB